MTTPHDADDDFAWSQPTNFEVEAPSIFPAAPADYVPQNRHERRALERAPHTVYAQPPSSQRAAWSDVDVLSGLLLDNQRKLKLLMTVTSVFLLVPICLGIFTGEWREALAATIFWFIIVAPTWLLLRSGKLPVQSLNGSKSSATFGRSYTQLSPDQAAALVLAAAKDQGIHLKGIGPTTWQGPRPSPYASQPPLFSVDVRPSIDRPGMTLITVYCVQFSAFSTDIQGMWRIVKALLESPPDAHIFGGLPSRRVKDSFDANETPENES